MSVIQREGKYYLSKKEEIHLLPFKYQLPDKY